MDDVEPTVVRIYHLTTEQGKKLERSALLWIDNPPSHTVKFLEKIKDRYSPDMIMVLAHIRAKSEGHMSTFTEFSLKGGDTTFVETHIFVFGSNQSRLLSLEAEI